MNANKLDSWVIKAQKGNQEAFHNVVIETLPELRTFVATRIPKIDMLDEIVQSTFVTAWTRLDRYRPQETFLPWLKGIAINKIRKELRDQARYLSSEGNVLDALVFQTVEAEIENESEIDLAQRLQQCLEKLTSRARMMIERRHLQSIGLKTLAQQFKMPASKVARTLRKIRNQLRDCAERQGVQV